MTETTTKPYLIRAIHEWCVDNGFTPYMAVSVDKSTRVPMAYVKGGEIVLNTSPLATNRLSLGNEWIEFQARFGGVSQDIAVPVEQVIAVYARENGQGMAFEVPKMLAEVPDLEDDEGLEQLIDEVLSDLDHPDQDEDAGKPVSESGPSAQTKAVSRLKSADKDAPATSASKDPRSASAGKTKKKPGLGLVSVVSGEPNAEPHGAPNETDPDDEPDGPQTADSAAAKKHAKNSTKSRKSHLTRIK